MVVPMKKYAFLVFHKDYEAFLNDLQEQGVLHVIEREQQADDRIEEQLRLINRFQSAIKFLNARGQEPEESGQSADAQVVLQKIEELQREKEERHQALELLNKQYKVLSPWGDFEPEVIKELEDNGFNLRFYVMNKKAFDPTWQQTQPVEKVNEVGNLIYLVGFEHGDLTIDLPVDEVKAPDRPASSLKADIDAVEKRLEDIETEFDQYAQTAIPALEDAQLAVQEQSDYNQVLQHTKSTANDRLKILEGWVPDDKSQALEQHLNEKKIVYLSDTATEEDSVPILLKNNWFARLFEPIGNLFSLPKYYEIDLTPFFAPFFLLFFGFCLGDAGYGLLLLAGASVYKRKAKPDMKPLMTLVQWLGVGTVLFGIVSGTLFGINLIEADIPSIADIQGYFLDPDRLFTLSLILGVIQIIFGQVIKAFNLTRQKGFVYALSTVGWIFLMVGSIAYYALTSQGIVADSQQIILYVLLGISGVLILFFNNPKNILASIGGGLWDVYSTVTGIMGDLLSYIRLFALGLSSAILGLVINSIALTLIDIGPGIGHLLFIVLLLIGHAINLFIAALGSFVHPMRLTFVEFYKNAGFTGDGKAYKPFQKRAVSK